jgi:7-keto-8-aminopelargonate synthetase-like enzyme
MADPEARKVDERRWRLTIVRHLGDLPRQYAALENAMGAFGEDFDLQQFKVAYNTTEDMEAYNRVQAVERAVGRLQNCVGQLADAGAKLARLPRPPMATGGSEAQQAFEALRDAGVIGQALCRRLVTAQTARTRIEHSYVQTPAGDVHRAATLVRVAARDYASSYRTWIEPYVARLAPESG